MTDDKKLETRGRHELFYVFYDQNDFVTAFGTAKQLVADGKFKSVRYAHEKASKIKAGVLKGVVVII